MIKQILCEICKNVTNCEKYKNEIVNYIKNNPTLMEDYAIEPGVHSPYPELKFIFSNAVLEKIKEIEFLFKFISPTTEKKLTKAMKALKMDKCFLECMIKIKLPKWIRR